MYQRTLKCFTVIGLQITWHSLLLVYGSFQPLAGLPYEFLTVGGCSAHNCVSFSYFPIISTLQSAYMLSCPLSEIVRYYLLFSLVCIDLQTFSKLFKVIQFNTFLEIYSLGTLSHVLIKNDLYSNVPSHQGDQNLTEPLPTYAPMKQKYIVLNHTVDTNCALD